MKGAPGLLLLLLPPVTAGVAGASGPGLVAAWLLAVVAVAVLVLIDLEGSEVVHVVYAIQVAALALAGGVLAALAGIGEVPPWAQVTLFLAPAVTRHLGARRRRRGPLSAEEEARLGVAPLAEVVAATGASPMPRAMARLLVARPGGREALLLAARAGTPAERRGAAEAAVALRAEERALALEVARELLRSPTTEREAKERALVAVWDGADAPLLEVLRGLGVDDPALRAAALEVRARSGDSRALDEWLGDATLDAAATAPGLVLALGPRARLEPRLASLLEASAEGTVARARVESLLRAAR